MGICTSKPPSKPSPYASRDPDERRVDPSQTPKSASTPYRKDDLVAGKQSPFFPFYSPSHPWIRNHNGAKVPIDILIFKLMRMYMRSSSLRKAALRAVSKTLTVDELTYLRQQFELLEPNKNGFITLETIKMGVTKHTTDAMNESRMLDFLANLNTLQYRGMDFEEFCSAALS
ncbi:CDPK-related kinase 5, partial [Cucurbita argyrosperma subsp. argyrosperma]